MSSSFESGSFPGRPRVLFIGFGRSTHAHAWIDLLQGSEMNVRFFAAPTGGVPPDDWPVRTYVTEYYSEAANSATRHRLFPQNRIRRLARRTFEHARGVSEIADVAGKWLAKIVREWQPHIIHTLGLEDAAYFFLQARSRYRLQGIGKWVAQVRGGPELALRRLSPEKADKLRAVFSECDWVIADNEQNYDYAFRLGLSRDRMALIGCVPGTGGIDVGELSSRWSGPPSARQEILWPKAYNCPQSLAQPVFEALKLAWDRIKPCKIHMLASTPETRMWFETLPSELREHSEITPWIPRERLLELMTQARVMLAPSLIDGVPNSLYEAMAAGAFPIVSPMETLNNLVSDGENVLFARNLYPQEMADALSRAMTDDELVDRAAPRNLAIVGRVADRNQVKRKVIKFYEQLSNDQLN